jgi:lipoate-protein ligase A
MLPIEFENAEWRLIKHLPAPGAWNMAVDETLLESVEQGESNPTLRLYAWEPPCLSPGYAQPFEDVDQARLSERGWHVVRRLTGGRAILHTDEVTYAVITPLTEPRLSGGVLESYKRVSRVLLSALYHLGLPVEADDTPNTVAPTRPQRPVCFEVPSSYEITYQGKKLIGSAQARRKFGLLQHGSLPMTGDLTRITQVLTFIDERHRVEAAKRLSQSAVNIEGIQGKSFGWEEVAESMINAFQQVFNLKLIPRDLTAAELERVDALVAKKYGNPDWTMKR